MRKIESLLKFLKLSYSEEYVYLRSFAKQENFALDPKSVKFDASKFNNVNFEEDMIEKVDGCDIVNFGISQLEKDSIMERLKKNKKYMPEDVNFVHFDLEKLYRCMEGNDFSRELFQIFAGLSYSEGSLTYGKTVSSFLESISRFPLLQDAFKSVLVEGKINYLVIGTSDKAINFVGSEAGAQRFHQLSVNHVLHDLGHATYDTFRGKDQRGDAEDARSRSRFGPITILSKYVLDVLEYFQNLKVKASRKSGKKMVFVDIDKIKSDRSIGLSFDVIQSVLREAGVSYDVRLLVGTRGEGKNPKSFTDKSDFDQDIFSYIMQVEEDQSIEDVFVDPKIPKEMALFFDRNERYLDEGDREKFESFVASSHENAIQMVIKDIENINKKMKVDGDNPNIQPAQGYLTYLSMDLDSEEKDSPLFVFNMMEQRLSRISEERFDTISEKGYVDMPKDSAVNSYVFSEGNRSRTLLAFNLLFYANIYLGGNFSDPIVGIISSNNKRGNPLSVGDTFSPIIQDATDESVYYTLNKYLKSGMIEFDENNNTYRIVKDIVYIDESSWDTEYHDEKINDRMKELKIGLYYKQVSKNSIVKDENYKGKLMDPKPSTYHVDEKLKEQPVMSKEDEAEEIKYTEKNKDHEPEKDADS